MIPAGTTWDILDWVQTNILDNENGLAAQLGLFASSSRPDHILSEGKDVLLYSDDGALTDYRLVSKITKSFTLYLEGVLSPPKGVLNGIGEFSIALESTNGLNVTLRLDSEKDFILVSVGETTTAIPLGSAKSVLSSGTPSLLRLVANGGTRLLDIYLSALSEIPVHGENLLGSASLIQVQDDFDAISFNLKGSAIKDSRLVISKFGISSKIISSKQKPVAVVPPDFSAAVGSTVTLDGLRSYDLAKSPLAYSWRIIRQPEKSNIVLSGAKKASGKIGDILFSYSQFGFSGNGFLVRTNDGGSTLTISYSNGEIIIQPAVQANIVKTTARDVILAIQADEAISKFISAEIIPGGNEWSSVPLNSSVELSGGTDSSLPVTSFVPSLKGIYEFGLTVTNSDGIQSTEATVVVQANVASSALGKIPDASFIWKYLSDAWRLVSGKEIISTFWSSMIQKVSDVLLQVVQAQDELSLKTFPSRLMSRWVSFPVREILPALSISRMAASENEIQVLFTNSDNIESNMIVFVSDDAPVLYVGDSLTWRVENVLSQTVGTVVGLYEGLFTFNSQINLGQKVFTRVSDGAIFQVIPVADFHESLTNKFVIRPTGRVLNVNDILRDSVGNNYRVVSREEKRIYVLDKNISIFEMIDSGKGLYAVDVNNYSEYKQPSSQTDEVEIFSGSFDIQGISGLYLLSGNSMTEINTPESTSRTLRVTPCSWLLASRAWVKLNPMDIYFFAKKEGSKGNGIQVFTKLGDEPSVRVLENSETIEITVRNTGETYIWEITRAINDETYPGFSPEAHALVSAVADDENSIFVHVPDTIFELENGAETGPLDWKILRRQYGFYGIVGSRVSFSEDFQKINFGDLIEFEEVGIKKSWYRVLANTSRILIIDGNPSLPAKPKSVIHTSKFRCNLDDVVDVPRLQSVIKNPGDGELFFQGTHFRVNDGVVEFFSEPDFVNDPGNAPDRLWAEVVLTDNSKTLENNFGILVGLPREAFSDAGLDIEYLSAVKGLFFIAYRGPSIGNIRIGSQIFANLPVAEEAGVIEDIQQYFNLERGLGRILIRDAVNQGTVRTYYFPSNKSVETNPDTGEKFKVGDSVKRFQPLCTGASVRDYISDPGNFDSGILEVEKYHLFYVLLDSDISKPELIQTAAKVISEIKPAYTKMQFGILHAVTDTVSLEDSTSYEIRLYLDDDRYTVEDLDPPFTSGYTHIFDHVDGAASTYDGKVVRIHEFDMSVGSGGRVPEHVLCPPDISDKLFSDGSKFDFVSDRDNRQKNYFDRKLTYGPEDIPEARVCTYFPINGGPPLARRLHHLVSGTGELLDGVLTDETKNFEVLGVVVGALVTFPGTYGYGFVTDVDVHQLKIKSFSINNGTVIYVVHSEERLDRLCEVEYVSGDEYRLYDSKGYFGHQNEIRVGYFVILNPGESASIGVIQSVEDGSTLVITGSSLPMGLDIPYRVIPQLVAQEEVYDVLSSAPEGPGMFARFDTIFRFDDKKTGVQVGVYENILGPVEVLEFLNYAVPDVQTSFYCWFDTRVNDYERDEDGNPVPGSAPPYLEIAPYPDRSHPWWSWNPDAWVVNGKFACSVIRLGNGEPDPSVTKYPHPLIV